MPALGHLCPAQGSREGKHRSTRRLHIRTLMTAEDHPRGTEIGCGYGARRPAAHIAAAMTTARTAGIDRIVFGDLFLQDVRAYRERNLAGTGITPVFPLWGRSTGALARDMLAAGVRAVLTCVDPNVLPSEFSGRAFDETLLADLPHHVDPCGERGEFHTFVWDGPGFSSPIDI